MPSNSGKIAAVASSAAAVPLVAQNFNRRGDASGPSLVIVNSSTAILYLLCSDGSAQSGGEVSATNFTYSMPAAAAAPVPLEIWGYRGPMRAIWAAVNGSALVTEFQ